jgi:hypothetical protein
MLGVRDRPVSFTNSEVIPAARKGGPAGLRNIAANIDYVATDTWGNFRPPL